MPDPQPSASLQAEMKDVVAAQVFEIVQIFSARGRIGRLRYLAYYAGANLVFGMVFTLASVLSIVLQSPAIVSVAGPAMGLSYMVFFVLVSIRRGHDMDRPGWRSVTALIPLVWLVYLLMPGTPGPNRYGEPPPAATRGLRMLAMLPLVPVMVSVVVVLVVFSPIAALAIPACSGHKTRVGVAPWG
jgi:uncharacterized membrane protein YhaH (DUF805 family)